MHDAGKIVPGLIIFLGLISFPLWYNTGSGKADYVPELAKAEGTQCVESTEYMKTEHMVLLNDWRDRVARDGERYITIDGVKWEMSLSNTCMKCHADKAGFCDKCHDYLGVTPYCWDCHLTPEDIEKWQSTEDDS
jgi:hypothetical protein